MTGSSSPTIDHVVTLWNTGKHAKAIEAVQADPTLPDALRTEVTRIETKGGPRHLLDADQFGDEVARRLHRTLVAIIDAIPT